MKNRNACAVVRMEEMYKSLTIEYGNLEYKKQVEDVVDEAKEKFEMDPNIIEKQINDVAGNVVIEFTDENFARDAGDFFEYVAKRLGIDHCD